MQSNKKTVDIAAAAHLGVKKSVLPLAVYPINPPPSLKFLLDL